LIIAIAGRPIRLHAVSPNLGGQCGRIFDTLVKATSLILVGLAYPLAFRMRFRNTGVRAVLLGALAPVRWCGPDLPAQLHPDFIPVMIPAGMLFGIRGLSQVSESPLQRNEIITTLMMNYIAIS
jgi:ABC-type uncharacterized transport system permease subunit